MLLSGMVEISDLEPNSDSVIPAKAGIQVGLRGKRKEWIPASAGMTEIRDELASATFKIPLLRAEGCLVSES
jgi:hypothetical protein